MAERKKKQMQVQNRRPIRIIGGGGDIGAVVVWGGAMAVAGVAAAFAMKRRFRRRKDRDEIEEPTKKKEEEIKKTENLEGENGGGDEDQKRVGLNNSKVGVKQTQTRTQIDSCDLVSAILGEKPLAKDDSAKERANGAQDIVPLINYTIPAHPEMVDDPFNTLNPDIQEIIPFTKLKPEFIAGIVEECKSLVIDKVDPPVPLKEKGPVERLILQPIISQVTLEAEALLSPITEVEESDHNDNDNDNDHDNDEDEEEEYEDEDEDEGDGDESVGEVEEASEETGESSSMFNDEAIWPAEMIEELSREFKEMKIDFERPEEEEDIMMEEHGNVVDGHKNKNSNKYEKCNDSDEEMEKEDNEESEAAAMPVEAAKTARLSRSRAWIWLYVFVTFLLVLLLFRFDAMSCVLS